MCASRSLSLSSCDDTKYMSTGPVCVCVGVWVCVCKCGCVCVCVCVFVCDDDA